LSHVVAIIQARMGSSRLPEKVMEAIGGAPMLARVVRRVQSAATVDQVVVATTLLARDDAIEELAERLGVLTVRGSEHDVLARYVEAALRSEAEVIVRITSDCPFIDAGLIDAIVTLRSDLGVDYASNTLEPRSFPRGLDAEAFLRTALEEADRLDRDPGSREHVTPFIRDSGRFSLASVKNDEDLSHLRWTVDTDDDLRLAREMAGSFDPEREPTWLELLEMWTAHPEWAEINSHVEQKPVVRQLPHPGQR